MDTTIEGLMRDGDPTCDAGPDIRCGTCMHWVQSGYGPDDVGVCSREFERQMNKMTWRMLIPRVLSDIAAKSITGDADGVDCKLWEEYR